MSQMLRYWINDEEIVRSIPDADNYVLPGVRWGNPWTLFTPAYWLSQFWMNNLDKAVHSPYRSHGNLVEEVVFCLLGGFGITAELATAAFEACFEASLIQNLETNPDVWSEILFNPLTVKGKSQHYRFPNQKAKFVAGAMVYLREHNLDLLKGIKLRDELLKINGIGLKTAGWITRNYTDADDVAILDIHIIRAGILCGIFRPNVRVERDYHVMETRFIEFSQALGVRPAILDCLIWDQMRTLGGVVLDAIRATSIPTNTNIKIKNVEAQQIRLL
jgi:N-glycosylase/DNA lyase